MNLILHIGTEKTGTTSIQEFLKKNIDQLKRNAIYIPQVPMVGDGNHRWLPLFANNTKSSDGFVRQLQFKSDEDRKKIIDEKKRKFMSECHDAANACNTLILSSEHLHSQLKTLEEIQRLRNLLEEVADKILIVIYIRDPLKMAVSRFSTAIKAGRTNSVLPSPSQRNLEQVFNYDQTIKRWKECFPDAKILVRRFERSLLKKGNVVIDFCSQVIDDFCEEEYEFVKPANQTLTLTGMALLRKLNEHFPRFVDKKPNPMRGPIVQFVMNNTLDGSKFLPSRDEFEEYKNHFSESCERVRSQFFPLEESLFIDQNEFAEEKIDLSEVEIDPHIFENLVESLWIQKRELQLRLENKIQK